MANRSWQASWIWAENQGTTRNEWFCFRKPFRTPEGDWKRALLRMTGDSRYVLFVNGQQVGRGNSRSWPSEQLYDTHDIAHLLRKDRENVLAVLVIHYGVSTFNYVRGRGVLLAQLDWLGQEGNVMYSLATDSSWRTTRYSGQDTRSPRMCPQLGFVERMDARLWDDQWTEVDFADGSWAQSVELGAVGIQPWTTLKERDIPQLTEESIYPGRVESISQVKTFQWSTVVDLRNLMVPDSVNHANRVGFTGLLATVIRCDNDSEAVLGFPNAAQCFGRCWINGVIQPLDQFIGRHPEKYVSVRLVQGNNLFVMDVTTTSEHGNGFRMGIYSEGAFEVVSPLVDTAVERGLSNSPFVLLGPFDTVEHIDHQPPVYLNTKFEHLFRAEDITSTAWFKTNRNWVSEVPEDLASREDVFGMSIWRREAIAHSVSNQLQNMVHAHSIPAEIPVFESYDTEIVIDFGLQMSGFLAFELEAEEGTIIDLYGYEFQYPDGTRQDTYGLDNTLRYTCREGRQAFVSDVRRGLRYLMLTVRNASSPVKLYNVHMNQSNFPVAEIGAFLSSDALLNNIWNISRHTTKLCMEDTFVDCSAYEQVYWVGDSRNEALIANYVYGADDLVRRCLRLVPGSKHQSPLYADQVPSGWSSVIPNWTFFWVIACHEHYMRTGEEAIAIEFWPHVRFTLEHYLEYINNDGLFEIQAWNLLDWAPIDQPDSGTVTHQNCYLAKALRMGAELARVAEDLQGEASFMHAADQLQIAINRHLWSEDKQAYLDCIHADGRRSDTLSMQTQVVAWLTGAAEGKRKRTIEGYLIEAPSGFVPIGSPFMSFFYYEALAGIGAYSNMLDDIRKNYGIMLEHGATTCWEMYPNYWGSEFENPLLTRSHVHAWSAAPAYFLGAYVLGVQPVEPGWRSMTIAPQPSGLSWARGSVPLPEQGRIDVDWRADLDRRTITIRVTAPKGTEVSIIVPEGFSGETILKSTGI